MMMMMTRQQSLKPDECLFVTEGIVWISSSEAMGWRAARYHDHQTVCYSYTRREVELKAVVMRTEETTTTL